MPIADSEGTIGLVADPEPGQAIIDRFLRSLPTSAPRIAARTAIGHALRVAPERFSVPCRMISESHGPLLANYLDHLRRVRGLEPKTCEGLLAVARKIVAWYDGQAQDQSLATMT